MTPIKVSFTIPGVATAQQRPRTGKHGHFYSPSSKEQRAIGIIALAGRVLCRAPLLLEEVTLTVHFYGLPAKIDLSNAVKLIEDAMNNVVYKDDKQIWELHLYRHETPKGSERTEVFVQTLK